MEIKEFSGRLTLAASKYRKEKDYWLNKLSGQPVKSCFPYDFDDPGRQKSYAGEIGAIGINAAGRTRQCETVHLRGNSHLFDRLIKVSKNSDYTLHMILTACLVALLYNYTGNSDIIVGMPVYHQEKENEGTGEGKEGKLINTALALRNRLEDPMNFKELLMEVRETVIEANKHQNYPIEVLLYHLNMNRSSVDEDFPLFDVVVLLSNIQQKTSIEHTHPNVIFSFLKANNTLEGTIEYNPQRYRSETIERIGQHYLCLLEEAIFNVKRPLSSIDLLSEEEKKQWLDDFNQRGAHYPVDQTIDRLFTQQAERTPDHIAAVGDHELQANYQSQIRNSQPKNRFLSITYSELNRKSNGLAQLLWERSIQPDAIIGIMMERSIGMLIGIMGILKAGGAYLPIDPDCPENRIDFILKDSRANVLVTTSNLFEYRKIGRWEDSRNLEIVLIDFSNLPSSHLNLSPAPVTSLAYIIYTSGTTGKPKGCLVEHRNIVRLMKSGENLFHYDERDVWTMFHSQCFDFSVWEMYGALLYGGKLILINKMIARDTQKYLDILRKEIVTILNQTPSAFYNLSHLELRNPKKELNIRYIIFGGEALKPLKVKKWQEKYPGTKLINMYGITETTVHVTYKEIKKREIELNICAVGKPIPTWTTYIMDPYQHLRPLGIAGELCVGGQGVGRGYLNQPELTRQKFIDNPYIAGKRIYRSGDLTRLMENGEIEYLGRVDQQVKIRGYRIELGEIESQLLLHPGIKEAVATANQDENQEKYLCAYFVPTSMAPTHPGGAATRLKGAELKKYLSRMLPSYMIPTYFVQVDRIPITPNGKIDRKALPVPEPSAVDKYIAPRHANEKKLVELWGEVLGIERNVIGIDSNFFEYGGNSLTAVILISKLQKAFNVNVALAHLFKIPTIRELAEYINKSKVDRFCAVQIAEKKEYYNLSPAQKRLYVLQQIELAGTGYNIPQAGLLEGHLDMEKLMNTFRQMMMRHESLRTSFKIVNGVPVQIIHSHVQFEIENYSLEGAERLAEKFKGFVRSFDLSRVPLLRAALIKIAFDQYIMLLDMHHIITDGTSMDLFLEECLALYAEEELPPLKLQYKDYSQWRNSYQQRKVIKKQEKYWIKQFADEVPVLNLPLDYPRPAVQSFEGNELSFELPGETTRALNQLALDTGGTLYMVLLAIYNVLLSKLSSQEDIVVGTPTVGRRHADLERLIGVFVNTLALRNYPDGNKTFIDFLTEIKERTLQAFENQEYQFEDLVEKVFIKRDISRNPIFDTMFALQNMEVQANDGPFPDFSQLRIKPFETEDNTSKFDLSLFCDEEKEGLVCSFEYCTKLFKKETIQRFIKYFEQVVAVVIENRNKKLFQIEIITEEERKRILYDFNDTAAAYPKEKPLQQLFEEQVQRTPDHVALIGQIPNSKSQIPNKEETCDEDISMTYHELNEKSDQLAFLLIEKGIQADNLVGIMAGRSIEMIIGILGVLKAGGAYLPIDPKYPEERIKYMLKDSRARILLRGRNSNDLNNINGLIVLDFEHLNFEFVSDFGFRISDLNSSNLAYIIYTSGSTGTPKGVMVEHHSVVNLVFSQKKRFSIDLNDRVLQFSPLCFDASVEQIFLAFSSGAVLVLISKEAILDQEKFEKYISTQLVSHIHAVPSFLNNMKIKPSNSLKRVISGGDICPVALAKKWSQVCDFYNEYGPTETTVTSIEIQIKPVDETLSVLPVGKPISNTIVYVLDKWMQPVPLNIAGELVIGGEGVARGYLNNPELTAEKFERAVISHLSLVISNSLKTNDMLSKSTNDLSHSLHSPHSPIYKTGDLARWLSGGNIEFLGRIDSQVKIRGFRIELGEIESQLLNHPEIKEAVVITRATQNQDNYLCAYINSNKQMTASELREYLSKNLPNYMVPSYFVFLKSIPLTPNDKLDRKALPDPEWKAGDEYRTPGNEMEKRLVEIWSKVLEIPADIIGIESNFFELGGHSLKATIFITKVQNELNIRLPLTEVFKTPTIRQLAGYIRNESKDALLSTDDYLVLLKRNTPKAKHLFFIHDGSGEVEGYVEFCNHLNIEFNCWGIRADVIKNYTPLHASIEEIAAEYVEKIKKVQPQGPYYIVGWSLGGTFAFEITLQLEKIGEDVSFLGLIDSPGPRENSIEETNQFSLELEINWVCEYLPDNEIKEKVKESKDINEIWPKILDHLEENNVSVEIIKQLIPHHLAQIIPNYNQQGIKELIYYLNMYRTLNHARRCYRPFQKIHSTLHYLKPSQSPREIQDDWQHYCVAPIKSYEIIGDHFLILKKQQVDQIAKLLDSILHNML